MNWTAAVDAYCERTGPEFWSEPLNAVTNLAFLIAAAYVWPRASGLPGARLLAVILAAIGVGSGLFHTLATRWAGAADTLPILIFILSYIYLATRDFFGASGRIAALAVAMALVGLPATASVFAVLGVPGAAAGYLPVPLLILGYGWALRHRSPDTARNLGIGAFILLVSLSLRTLDQPLCSSIPFGTHFLWHVLNAVMLGWMILVYRAHVLAGQSGPR